MLAARRLTESQLWQRLERRGFDHDEIRTAVASCVADGFIDDALFAKLYVDGRPKAVGNARLVAELVRKGIDRRRAQQAVADAGRAEPERLNDAIAKRFVRDRRSVIRVRHDRSNASAFPPRTSTGTCANARPPSSG